MLKRVRKRLRKFQDGQENVQFNLGSSSSIDDKHYYYYSEIGCGDGGIATVKDTTTTHVLMFCQTDDNDEQEQ